MGMFDWDGGSVVSSSSRQHKRRKASGGGTSSKHSGDRSRSRSRSRHRKASGGGGLENFLTGGSHYRKHNSSRASGLGGLGEGSNYRKHGSSRGSFFGLGGNGSSKGFFGLGKSFCFFVFFFLILFSYPLFVHLSLSSCFVLFSPHFFPSLLPSQPTEQIRAPTHKE